LPIQNIAGSEVTSLNYLQEAQLLLW